MNNATSTKYLIMVDEDIT